MFAEGRESGHISPAGFASPKTNRLNKKIARSETSRGFTEAMRT
jgi:hypothetical protein